MERKLVLLGMLGDDEMYGYQINELVDEHIGSSLHLTKPTTYRILHALADKGLIKFREEKEGNRPTRRVYEITSAGRSHFKKLLKQSLRKYTPSENVNVISLAYLDVIPVREARSLLEERLTDLTKKLDELFEDETQHGIYQLVIENQILHLSAELEWLKDVIVRL